MKSVMTDRAINMMIKKINSYDEESQLRCWKMQYLIIGKTFIH